METTQTLIKVARLYYFENLPQREIAANLNISRIKVHRLLLKAKEEGLIEIKINVPSKDYSELEIKIEKQYGLKECNIVPSSEQISQIHENMGKALSTILERHLKKNTYLGMGWGATLRGAVDNVSFDKPINTNIIPLVGGLGSDGQKINANAIVRLMAHKIGGKGYILNCPAFVKNKEVKDMFMNEKVVKDVFSLVKKVNTAVVSIGNLNPKMTVRKLDIMKEEELSYLKGLNAIGDVNANFINKEGEPVINKMQDKIINTDLKSLEGIKNVIGMGFNERKVEVIRAALKKRIINMLITDSNTAESILL